tara:strand:+ start:1372 stop:1509 length:138 start_codon:yes stop_codon:yes gene_type:complete
MTWPAHKPTPLSALPTGNDGFAQSAHCGYKLKDISIRIEYNNFIT